MPTPRPPKYYSQRGKPSSQPNHMRPSQSQTLHQEQFLGFALGVCSGPKGPIIDFPIFGSEGGPQPLSIWRPPQIVKGCAKFRFFRWGYVLGRRALSLKIRSLASKEGPQPLWIWRPPQIVNGWAKFRFCVGGMFWAEGPCHRFSHLWLRKHQSLCS